MKSYAIVWFVWVWGMVGCTAVAPSPSTITAPAPCAGAAVLTLAPSATAVAVGQPLTITATLDNSTGCYGLGLPAYTLRLSSGDEATPVLEPQNPERITSPRGSVGAGQVETVQFVLAGAAVGSAVVEASVSYEYTQGANMPFVWGGLAAVPVTVDVTAAPFDIYTLPECQPPTPADPTWEPCVGTDIAGSAGWTAVAWGARDCIRQMTLVNLNTGEIRRWHDRPQQDFEPTTADSTQLWGNKPFMVTMVLSAEQWLLLTGHCEGGQNFLYNVAEDSFRPVPLGSGAAWNSEHTAALQYLGYNGLTGQYQNSIAGYNVLTEQAFSLSGDRYMWTADESHALVQTLTGEAHEGLIPTDVTFYDALDPTAERTLVTFSPPRSIQRVDMSTGAQTLLAGEDGYSYWLCESAAPCAWQEDWVPIRRIPAQPAQTFLLEDFNHPAYSCYMAAVNCTVPVEYFLLNWRTGEQRPWSVIPTPTPAPTSVP